MNTTDRNNTSASRYALTSQVPDALFLFGAPCPSNRVSLSDPGFAIPPASGGRKNSISTMDSDSVREEQPAPVYASLAVSLR